MSSVDFDAFVRWVEQNLAVVAIVGGLLALVGFLFWVLSIAAQGALVYGANEAAEDRSAPLGTAWAVGFGKWGRTFMIGLVLGIPVAVIAAVFIGVMLVLGVGGAAAGDAAGAGAIFGGLCLILPVFIVVMAVLGVGAGIIYQLALRYGVLDDTTFGQAIKRGWDDLWAKRGALTFWLVMILPGIAFGIALLIPIAIVAIPVALLLVAEKYVIAAALGVVMVLVLMLPSAIYGTFVSAAWTVFFRAMTGREGAAFKPQPRPGAVVPQPPYAAQATYPPQPPYAPQSPPAPPAYEPPVAPPAYEPAPPAYEPPVAPSAEAVPSPLYPADAPIVDVEVPMSPEEYPPADA
jgi:hypothetical protein